MYDIKVSIIIPVYNVEKYLRECLDSVVNQTLQDIEIICINDGSTDHSVDILQEYAAVDSRITVLTQENKGLSAARNVGIRHATGKYIYFLDSDDYIERNAMERLYQQADENNLDILYFDRDIIYDTPECQEKMAGRKFFSRDKEYSDIYSGYELFITLRSAGHYSVTVWTLFLSRSFCIDNQLQFKEGIYHEDLLFSLQAILAAKRASHRNWVLYHYRIRENSITESKKNIRHLYGVLYTIMEIKNILWNGCFPPDVETQILKFIETETKHAVSIYSDMPDDERAQIATLRPVEINALDSFLKVDDLALKLKAAYQTSSTRQEKITELQEKLTDAYKTSSARREWIAELKDKLADAYKISSERREWIAELKDKLSNAYDRITMLQKTKSSLEAQLHDMTATLRKTESTLITCQSEIKSLTKQYNDLRKAFLDMENSWSFRLGRVITWLPRVLKKYYRRWKQNCF